MNENDPKFWFISFIRKNRVEKYRGQIFGSITKKKMWTTADVQKLVEARGARGKPYADKSLKNIFGQIEKLMAGQTINEAWFYDIDARDASIMALTKGVRQNHCTAFEQMYRACIDADGEPPLLPCKIQFARDDAAKTVANQDKEVFGTEWDLVLNFLLLHAHEPYSEDASVALLLYHQAAGVRIAAMDCQMTLSAAPTELSDHNHIYLEDGKWDIVEHKNGERMPPIRISLMDKTVEYLRKSFDLFPRVIIDKTDKITPRTVLHKKLYKSTPSDRSTNFRLAMNGHRSVATDNKPVGGLMEQDLRSMAATISRHWNNTDATKLCCEMRHGPEIHAAVYEKKSQDYIWPMPTPEWVANPASKKLLEIPGWIDSAEGREYLVSPYPLRPMPERNVAVPEPVRAPEPEIVVNLRPAAVTPEIMATPIKTPDRPRKRQLSESIQSIQSVSDASTQTESPTKRVSLTDSELLEIVMTENLPPSVMDIIRAAKRRRLE